MSRQCSVLVSVSEPVRIAANGSDDGVCSETIATEWDWTGTMLCLITKIRWQSWQLTMLQWAMTWQGCPQLQSGHARVGHPSERTKLSCLWPGQDCQMLIQETCYVCGECSCAIWVGWMMYGLGLTLLLYRNQWQTVVDIWRDSDEHVDYIGLFDE